MTTTESYSDLLDAMLNDPWELAPRRPSDVVRYGQERAAAREAVEAAATSPADQVAAAPSARALAAAAPALPPLKLPKLSDRTLNGKRIEELLEAGVQAARKGKNQRPALVLTTAGVRITPDLAKVADDADVIVLAQLREVRRAVSIDGKTPLQVAQQILDRELEGLAADQRVSA